MTKKKTKNNGQTGPNGNKGEERQRNADYTREKRRKEKEDQSNSVYEIRDLGGGIGDRQYFWRNPGGMGVKGIGIEALRQTAENTDTNRVYKETQAKAKKQSKSPLRKK